MIHKLGFAFVSVVVAALFFNAPCAPAQVESVLGARPRIIGAVDETDRIALTGNVRPEARPENDSGLVSDALPVDRGRLFRRVNKVGKAWGEGITEKAVWHIVKAVLGSATHREASWSRSNSFWGTFWYKRPNATLAASSGFDQPLMIALASSRILELGAPLWKGC